MGKVLSIIVLAGVCGLAATTCWAEPQERLIFDDEKQGWTSIEDLETPLEGTPADAQALMEQGQYRKAEKMLKPYLEATPVDEPGRAEALFLYAEAAFIRGEYGVADERYRKVINEYPNTRQFALSLRRELEIAKAWLAGKKKRVLKVLKLNAEDEALDILSMIEQLAGGYRIAEVALWTKGDHFFQTGQFELAEIAYRRLAQNYNSPRYQNAAMYGASSSALASFPGVKFDDSSLLDAQELYSQYMRKFPHESEKQNVPVILDQIKLRRAEKDYEVARFYRKIHQPKAAVYYYEFVIRNWPDTLYAQKAQVELDQLDVKN
jgi:outer membrane protein assembly factor BamD (BamD/ComL family)